VLLLLPLLLVGARPGPDPSLASPRLGGPLPHMTRHSLLGPGAGEVPALRPRHKRTGQVAPGRRQLEENVVSWDAGTQWVCSPIQEVWN
jgi:hypothetical protein